jgi:hypothetical protein
MVHRGQQSARSTIISGFCYSYSHEATHNFKLQTGWTLQEPSNVLFRPRPKDTSFSPKIAARSMFQRRNRLARTMLQLLVL